MQHKLTFLLLLLPFLLFASTNDRALYIEKYASEKKVALVIGNGSYGYFSILNNAINDAKDMKNILESRDFKVHYLRNATKRQMDKKVDEFVRDLKNGGVGMFYYAGHGVEVEGKNYLIPIDMEKNDKIDIKYDALEVNKIIEKMEDARNRLNILVLDACRNDPYSRGGGGLAAINNAKGMYVAYATAPGEVASDGGSGSNGLFTKHLITEIQKDQTLENVFKNTRTNVYNESNGKQIPWTSSSVMGDFYFTIPVNDVTPQSKRESYPKSTFSFDNVAPTMFTLTINPIPYDSTVQITNISPKYHDGIKLKKGSYNIKVSKDGYISKSGTIELKSDLKVDVKLEKEKVVFQAKEKLKDIYIDKDTNLMWQDDISVKTTNKNWDDAIKHCQNLTFAGYSDWRLPTIDELLSITDDTKYNPAIKTGFKNVTAGYYWSSSPSVSDSSGAWNVYFKNGDDSWIFKGFKFLVRCVRDSK